MADQNYRYTRNVYLYATIVFALYILVLDYFLTMRLALGLAYSLVLIFTLFMPGRKPVVYAALGLSFLVLVGAIFSYTDHERLLTLAVNRILDLLLIWFAAFLIIKFKQLEKERIVSQTMFEKTLNSAPSAVFITKKEGSNILYVNEAAAQMLRSSKDELIDKKGSEFYVDPEVRQDVLYRLENGQEVSNYEMQLVRADGSMITVLSSVQPIIFRGEECIITVNVDISEQKKTEKKFRDLLESAPDSMIIIDDSGEIVIANERSEDIFGYNRSDIIGENLQILLPQQTELVENKASGVETIAKRKDGKEFPVEISYSPIETSDKLLYSAAIRDISERKEKEKEIIRSRNYYLTLLEEFPALIWRTDTNGKCDYFNQTWLNFTGRTFEDDKDDGWVEIVHPEDVERVLSTFKEAFKERRTFNLEYRLLRHDGEYRWLTDHGRPMYDLNGKFSGYIGNCYDVTEKKEHDQVLRDSEEKFHAIFNQTFQFIGLLTPEGITIEANDTALDFSGIQLEDVVGKPFWEMEWWSDSEEVQDKLRSAIKDAANGKFVRYEETLTGKENKRTTIDFSIKPVYDSQEKIKWLIPEGRDITAIKEAQQALKESEHNLENTLMDAPVPIMLSSNKEEKLIFANKEAAKVLGIPREKILDYSEADLFRSENARLALKQAYEENGYLENYEISMERDDGEVLDLLISIRPIQFKNDTVAVIAFSDITFQKRVEKKFRDLLESAPDAMIILDNHGNISIVNAQTEHFFGYSKDELIGKSAEFLLPKTSRAEAMKFITKNFNDTAASALRETMETKGLCKDGKTFPAEVSFGTIETEEGVYISAAIRDITERKQAQKELEKKHKQLSEAQEVAHIGSWEWNLESNRLSWSDEMFRIYGLDPEEDEINYDIFIEFIHPDDVKYVQSIVSKAIETQESFNFYHRINRKNGDIRILNARGKVISKNGKTAKLLGSGLDVTDLKLAEEKIRESEEKFRYFVETSNDLIWSINSDSHWNYLNPQACREIYEYEPEEMLGQDFEEYAHPDSTSSKEFLEDLYNKGAVFHHEVHHITSTGRSVFLKFNGILLKDKEGNVLGATGTATDISELKRAEESLREIEGTLRSLYDITTNPDTVESEEKMDSLLELACQKFKMDVAYILQIKDQEAKLINSFTCRDDIALEHLEHLLERSFVEELLEMDEPLLLEKTKKTDYSNLELFKEAGIRSFIGEKILIAGIPYGTVNLVSKKKRKEPFKQTDIEIIKLMAQWVGGVIQREQIKQNMMNAIVDTEEQERKRFAEDLHDGLGQILSAVKLNLSAMEKAVKELDNGVADFYENSLSLVDYAMQETKSISQNLMPASLENYGLKKTMETLCERMASTNSIKINFHSFSIEKRYPRNIEIGIYRIAQELIHNAMKHATAEEVNIQIIQHRTSIMLMVEDDGKGFNIHEENASNENIGGGTGMGLSNIMTRVKSLHGTISIDSSPGYGTVITVEIPLNQ